MQHHAVHALYSYFATAIYVKLAQYSFLKKWKIHDIDAYFWTIITYSKYESPIYNF